MPDKAALRTELEITHTAFKALVQSIPPANWNRSSGNRAWKVRHVLSHMASSPATATGSINLIRLGKGYNPPRLLAGLLNVIMTRMRARKATPESVLEEYAAGQERLLETIDAIEDDEWTRGARFFGKTETVESLIHGVSAHYREHAGDVRSRIVL